MPKREADPGSTEIATPSKRRQSLKNSSIESRNKRVVGNESETPLKRSKKTNSIISVEEETENIEQALPHSKTKLDSVATKPSVTPASPAPARKRKNTNQVLINPPIINGNDQDFAILSPSATDKKAPSKRRASRAKSSPSNIEKNLPSEIVVTSSYQPSISTTPSSYLSPQLEHVGFIQHCWSTWKHIIDVTTLPFLFIMLLAYAIAKITNTQPPASIGVVYATALLCLIFGAAVGIPPLVLIYRLIFA